MTLLAGFGCATACCFAIACGSFSGVASSPGDTDASPPGASSSSASNGANAVDGGGGGQGASDESGESGASASASCLPTLDCAAATLPASPTRDWRHAVESRVTTAAGDARHRGRDLFFNPNAPQWLIGKFAYGGTDTVLKDEEVDIYVQRSCTDATFEKLGTALTGGSRPTNPTIEGVDDGDGRIVFQVPNEKALGAGRHRIRLVVGGDNSFVDMFIDVVPSSTAIFVSDVDGTLTSSEDAVVSSVVTGTQPETHPDAPEALQALATKGYRPIYLTARPEWLVEGTRAFLKERGFPLGLVHTSLSSLGAGSGDSAAAFKTAELQMLTAKGLTPQFGFGNMPSDSDAYTSIQPINHRIFYQISGTFTGKGIQSYSELLPIFAALPAVCK